MTIAIAPLTMKPPLLDGLSQRLLESHYENNYGGALRRLNEIDSRLAALDWSSASVFEINGLKREQLIAADSVILHEVYFDSLGGSGGAPESAELAIAIERIFDRLSAGRRNSSRWERRSAAVRAG